MQAKALEHPTITPNLLSILICPRCKAGTLKPSKRQTHDRLVCLQCHVEYRIEPPGIPQLMPSEEIRLAVAKHEQHWDLLSEKDYEGSCRQSEAVLEAIDAVHLQYCRGDVLEAGCGSGRFLAKLSGLPQVRSISGLDVSLGMLRRASAKGPFHLVHSPAEALPFANESFDTVTSTWSALKYVRREQGYREICRGLRAGGMLTFDLINYWPYLIDYAWRQHLSQRRWPPRGLSNEYILSSNMKSARHEVALLEDAGFRVTQIQSVWFLPFIRRVIKRLGYWPGYWGSRIGYDTIFICQKVR